MNDPSLHAASSENAGRAAQPLRILIADDDRDAVLMLSTILKDEGHDVRCVYDGDAVVTESSRFDPDVVLLDIGMPERTGYEVARYLRKRYGEHGVMLVAITGWQKSSDKILAKLAGFDHHLAKPFEPQALLNLLSGLSPKSGPSNPRPAR